jgi:uncharacterized membrane protein YkvA (DUF1232 family)
MASRLPLGIAQRFAEAIVRYPKFFAILVIAYVLSPIDLLPEGLFGPVGFLDDMLVVLLPLIARAYVKKRLQPKHVVDTTATPLP